MNILWTLTSLLIKYTEEDVVMVHRVCILHSFVCDTYAYFPEPRICVYDIRENLNLVQ